MVAAKKKSAYDDVEDYVSDKLPDLNPAKPDEKKKLKVKEIEAPKASQARVDTDPGYNVDVHRAESFAEKMKAGEKFPPVKVCLVEDMPGKKGTPVHVLWDGHHTHAGAEIAKIAEVDALIWKGTWAQCLAAAASFANSEHENAGKPKSFKDRIRSCILYVKGLAEVGVTKRELPSNRQLAKRFAVSHTAVGDADPCDRRQEGTKTPEQKKEEKANVRANGAAAVAAGAAHLNGTPAQVATKRFEVVKRDDQTVAGTFEAETPAKALEAFKTAKPDVNLVEYVTKELVTTPPKSGSVATIGFDWARMESDLGSLARGLDGMGDIYKCKDSAEWKNARANLNSFATILKGLRKELTAKKPVEAKK